MEETTIEDNFNGSKLENMMELFVMDRDPWVVTAVSLIGLIILIGCTGNIMVLLAVKKVKKLQTISNVFVMNLSVCDFLFVGCVLPFNIYTYIADGWFISASLCKFVGFMGYTLTGTTIITISLIAFNRYKLVLDLAAYKQLYTRRNVILMLLIAWLVPVLCLLPALFGVFGKFGYVPMLVTCNLMLDHRSQLFKIFLMLVRAGIPCGLIIYYYARIYHATTTSHRRFTSNSRNLSSLDLHNHKKEMHMTRMMLIIFLVFVISYFPCTITGMIDWSNVLSKQYHMLCQISIYIGSAINPLVYGLMNSQFRQAYRALICCSSKKSLKYNNTPTRELKGYSLEVARIYNRTNTLKSSIANFSEPSSIKKNIKFTNISNASQDEVKNAGNSDNMSEESVSNEGRPMFTLE